MYIWKKEGKEKREEEKTLLFPLFGCKKKRNEKKNIYSFTFWPLECKKMKKEKENYGQNM